MIYFVRKLWQIWPNQWSSGAVEQQEQQLVQLYWNRAELKKELAKTQDENKALRLQLQQQIEVRHIAEDKLLRLEQFLGDPIHGHHASAHFQLRLLWRTASELLEQFSAELHRLQETQERAQHDADCQSSRANALVEIENAMQSLRLQLDQVAAQLTSAAEQQSQLVRIWHFAKRRELDAWLVDLNDRYHRLQQDLYTLQEDYSTLSSEPMPIFAGMSVAGSRLVNTAVLAFAEWLMVILPSLKLAALARVSMQCAVEDARYGEKEDCVQISVLVATALQRLAQLNPASMEFAERARMLRTRAVYASAIDSVPTELSLGYLQQQDIAHHNQTLRISILADDYWGVSRCLLRAGGN